MTMPNFLIIGAAKAGTTAFYSYLKQHPDIYMSLRKETRFFACEGESVDYRGPRGKVGNCYAITNIQSYREQFQSVTNEVAIGEASPLYLYHPKAPERIRYYIPKASLIAILRDPAERAYSSFLHATRDGQETIAHFSQALKEEEKRIRNNWVLIWHYKNAGFYYVQLKRYFDMFDRDQIKVYLYEDFKSDSIAVLQDSFRFLGVNDTFVPDISMKPNMSFIPRNRTIRTLLMKKQPVKSVLKPLLPKRLRHYLFNEIKNWNSVKPSLPPETRSELIALYKEDILKLQDLIQRDLTKWLK